MVTELNLASRIQNTLIGPAVTAQQVRDHVASAVEHGFNAVTVSGSWAPLARELLSAQRSPSAKKRPSAQPEPRDQDSPSGEELASRGGAHVIRLGALLDFPYGSASTTMRVAGAADLAAAGADEIDSTVNIGLLLSGRQAEFEADLAAIVQAAAPLGVKFMLELALLDARQRDLVVGAAVNAGAVYVKNASRGSIGIADPATIAYLRRRVPESVGVKASGGIRAIEQVRELLDAGADLVGTSTGVDIVTGARCSAGSLDAY